MPLYESIFIVRQDVSSHDVDDIMDGFIEIIKKNKGKVVKHEYWGMRNLAYEINNNRKGHYVMMAIDANTDAIKEMEYRMKYNQDLLRFMTLRVDAISKDPSPILKAKSSDLDDVVDVTVTKDSLQD